MIPQRVKQQQQKKCQLQGTVLEKISAESWGRDILPVFMYVVLPIIIFY